MSDQRQKILSQTERATRELQHEAAQYCNGEPLTVIQTLMFRSFIQEAHLYALLDQMATGKMDADEMQKRCADHMQRIATELRIKRGGGAIITPKRHAN